MENIGNKRELISESAESKTLTGIPINEETAYGSFLNAVAKLVHYYGVSIGDPVASSGFLSRFIGKSEEEEKTSTFTGSGSDIKLNYALWDCLADFIGTGQSLRHNEDNETEYIENTWLDRLIASSDTQKIGITDVPDEFIDFKYGLHLFLRKHGYSLDGNLSRTTAIISNENKADIQGYLIKEIDEGRPVLVHLENDDTVLGIGYNGNNVVISSDMEKYLNVTAVSWGEVKAISIIKIIEGSSAPPPLPFADITEMTNGSVRVGAVFGDVEEKYYSLNGEDWYFYKGPVTVNENTSVYFKSEDSYGNTSKVAEYVVSNIDRTPPKKPTLITVSRPGLSKNPVTITASFSHLDVDVVKRQYSFDNKNWIDCTFDDENDYTADVTVDFNRTVYFRAVDEAGNAATNKIKISNIIPDMTITLEGVVKKNQLEWSWNDIAGNGTGFTVSYEIKLDDKISLVQTGTSFKWTAGAGKYTLSVRAVYTASGVPTKYSAWATKSLSILDSTAPKISKITSTVNKYSATLKISATDNVKVAKYVISYGKKSQTVTSNTATLTGLAVGRVAVSVVAYDAAGNKSAAKKINLTVKDVTPPSKVTTLYAPSVTNKYKGTFKWTAATDNSGKIAKYEIQLDNGKIYTSTKTTLSISKLTVGKHTYRVRAIDKNKNVGAWSAVKSFTVKDYTAPKISKLTATVKGYTATLKITATDNVKATKYVISYGKKSQTVTTNTATLTGLAVGKVAVSVVAYDAAGNKSTAKKINLTVKDSTPPSKVTTLYAPSVTNKYKGTFKWTAATDNSGKIAKYEIQLDNGKIYTSTKTTLSVSNLKVGNHTYRVRAIDKNKNIGAWSAVKSFTVKDMTAPATVSLSAKVSGNNATLTWKKPKDNVGVTKYVLKYGNKSVTLSGSATKYVIYGLNKGTYSYSMIAYDAAGNAGKAKTGKITIKQELAPARAAEALYAADFAAPEALFAPQTDILAYCNDLQGTANLSDSAALTADKKEERSLLAALS